MQRSKALVIVTRQLHHVCPYKRQDVLLAMCYFKAQDAAERDFCYGCDYVEKLKERFGLRTFRRAIWLSPCRHCAEAASLHDAEGKGLRVKTCPGFEPMADEGWVYVPTNIECTEWMTVNVATGERKAYVDFRTERHGEREARRFHLPLLGAPGTVPNDSRDDVRIEAATFAERKRRGWGAAREDNGETPDAVKVKTRKPRKSK